MDPNAPTATPPAEPAAPASFLQALSAPPTPAPETAAAPAAPATPPTPATPAAPPTPAAATPPVQEHGWLQDLGGDFKTPDEVKQALASLTDLRANQLTDDQRAVLRLSEDADAFREFNQLTHTDYTKFDDEALLFEAFRQERPGMDEDAVRALFEQQQDLKYPGLANEPADRMHKAHLAERSREAKQVRSTLTQGRDERLATLKKGALGGETPAQQQQRADEARAAHLDRVKTAVSQLADGYKFTVDADGTPLNLAVEAKDLPALQAVMENPLAALLNEDQTALDPQKLLRFAAFQVQGNALLAAARRAGQQGAGPAVSVDELHNADGTPLTPAAGGDGSLSNVLAKTFAPVASTKPRW